MIMRLTNLKARVRRSSLLPKNIRNKILPSENLVHDDLEVMDLVVVDGDPDRAVLGEEVAEEFEARVHEG